ncbi:STAS domain-containing protein [Streptomyces cinereoruber]|uniref:STAS domain-containing protein n=1 Tax=Streptomyces cinereoruber TaxID=67260 RepID=UPI0036320D21
MTPRLRTAVYWSRGGPHRDDLSVSVERAPARGSLITVEGEVCAGRAADLYNVLTAAMNSRPGPVKLDLLGVTSCDLATLRALLRARRRAAGEHRVLRVRLSPGLARLTALTGSGSLDSSTLCPGPRHRTTGP